MDELPCRRRLRLAGYDYSQAGAYFFTVCTHQHRERFGKIFNGEMQLNPAGEIVWRCWNDLPQHHPTVQLDAFIVMPNHLHGIIVLEDARAGQARPLQVILGSFKSSVSRALGGSIWQRGYWEHIIRTEREWNEIRQYIEANASRDSD